MATQPQNNTGGILLGPSEINKLKTMVEQCVIIMTDRAALLEGMNDTVKAVAEEIGVSNKMLKRVISTVYNNDYDNKENELSELDTILGLIGQRPTIR